MYSDNEKVVLCGASAYEQKYYFNQDFASLPQSVQDELHVMCVMFTVEIGGIFTMWFDSDGSLQFETEAVDADAMYDEIGGALRIKQYQEEKKELLESLELYYRVFFLGEEVPEEALIAGAAGAHHLPPAEGGGPGEERRGRRRGREGLEGGS